MTTYQYNLMRPQDPWSFSDSDCCRDYSAFMKKHVWSESMQRFISFAAFQLGTSLQYTCCRKLSLIQTLPADQGQLHVCPLHAQNAQSWAAQRGQKAAQELLGYQPLSCVMLMVQVCSSEQCSGLIEWDWVKHRQSNAPRLCPSLTLAKNAPVEIVLLCFCVFASELFTLQW